MTTHERSPDTMKQDNDALAEAEEALEHALKVLRRVRAKPETRERSSTILHAARAAYAAVREIGWREGIPTEAELAWISRLVAERHAEREHLGPDPATVAEGIDRRRIR